MMGWGDALVEVDYNIRKIEAELEQDRMIQIAKHASVGLEKESRRRSLSGRLGGLMAGFWCWWERRLATEPGAAAC
jgi:hypothetical protein